MARADTAGMTDYSHQSIDDILKDLNNCLIVLKATIPLLEDEHRKLAENKYWKNVVSEYKWIFSRTNIFFETVIKEIEEIKEQLLIEVQTNHVQRLHKLDKTSYEIYMEWNDVWINDVKSKEYGNPNFLILESLRNRCGNILLNLFDLSNMAERLKDYLGRKGNLKQSNSGVNNKIEVNVDGSVSGNLIIGDDNEISHKA